MARTAIQTSILVGVLISGLLLFGAQAQAQTALEKWATQQISDKTGIDANLLATLFVSQEGGEFILAFVFINEEVMESNIKPQLKESIAPFVGQKAMLTLVVPTRSSRFNALDISFAQDGMIHLISSSRIHAVTEDFLSGQLPAKQVSAGVLELPEGISIDRAFQISYQQSFSTTFSMAAAERASGSPGREGLSEFLLFILQGLLFFFLFPFLVSI